MMIEQKITETLTENYMPYAMSVIVSRAIPEIDGFKPSHRKLLYTMYKMGLLTGARTKSANVVGQTMKLNPHGDMAIYETLVRLTRGNGALLHPLVDSKGNFGRAYSRDMAFAAARYTEVKLETVCAEFFNEIDKDTVDFVDNYDGTLREPRLLPTAFPNILVNPNTGIAVGMASSIASFNLGEITDTCVKLLDNVEFDLAETLKAPDFSTGAQLIYNENEIRNIYRTGRGTVRLRSKYRFKDNCIEIYEIPYSTTCEAIIDKLAELIKQGKLKEVSDVRDETDLNGLKIAVDVKRGVDPDKLMVRLFKQTSLEDSFSCNFNILVDGYPKVLGVIEILNEWIKFRIGSVKRRLAFDIGKLSEKLHLLEGLAKILLDIDKAIWIIRNTEHEADVLGNLMDGFSIDRVQAEFIAEIRLRNLNKEYILKRVDEIESLRGELDNLRFVLDSENEVRKIIKKQLKDIAKKYSQPRRTEITNSGDIEMFKDETFVDDYNLRLFLTAENYLKKIPLTSLRAGGEQKLKSEDRILTELETKNTAEALFFSNFGNVYKLRLNDITDTKLSALGDFLPNILELRQDERIIYMTATQNYEGFMLFGFENGKAAKIDLKSYETKTNRKKLTGAYSTSSPLCCITHMVQDCDMAAFSNIGKAMVFNTDRILPKTTRQSQGVNVLNSKRGSSMVRLCPLAESELNDPDYYRTKNIPATGYYLK